MKTYFLLFVLLFPVLGCTGQTEMKGRVSQEDLHELDWFRSGFDAYTPSEVVMSELNDRKDNYSVVIFGGEWCPDTRRTLPSFMKVLSETGLPEEKIQIWMLDKNFSSGGGPEKNLSIRSVPTFVIYEDNEEVGRLSSATERPYEEAILDVIKSDSER